MAIIPLLLLIWITNIKEMLSLNVPVRAGLISTPEKDDVNFRFNPDPNAIVVGNTLYVFTSCDCEKDNANWLGMTSYLLYTTSDVTMNGSWVNHGIILEPAEDFPDIEFKNKKYYAPGVVYKNGFFYLFLPFYNRSKGISNPRLGIVRSSTPTVRKSWTLHSIPSFSVFDPALMIDRYSGKLLIYGNYNKPGWYKPMVVGVMNEQVTDLASPLTFLGHKSVEAMFAFQREVPNKGWKTYIQTRLRLPLSKQDAIVNYITPNPLYLNKGVRYEIIAPIMTAAPAHTSIVYFNERWLLFYHCAILSFSGNKFKRSTCMDEITFKPDGTIIKLDKYSCDCKGVAT